MKNRKLQILASALMIFSAGAVLTSCGGGVANAGEKFELKTLEDLKENSSAENPIKVEFWHSFGHNISKNLDPMIDSFEAEMAEQGIYIDVRCTSVGGGYDGLRARVNLGTKSNSIPTMILGYPDHFADYIDSGILLPLDSYVNASDANIGLNGDYAWDDFIESYRKENLMDVDGDGKDNIAGIPFNKSTEVMYYNASAVDPILKEKGYYDQTTGKWLNPTWEQLWTVSEELKTKVASSEGLTWTDLGDKTKKVDYPVFIDSSANFFITTARQWSSNAEAASKVYTTKDSAGGKVTFKNQTTVTAQNYFKEKADAGLWNLPDKVNQSYGSYLMANGTSFISIGSTAGVNNNASHKYELKCTTVPQKENGVSSVIQQGTNCAILSKNSNNLTRLSAWLLIKYLTSTENTVTFSRNTGYLPVRESAKNSAEFTSFLANENDPFDGNAAKCLNAAYAQLNSFYTDVAFSGSSIVRDEVDKMIQSVYCYNKSIIEAMDTAYTALKDFNINCEDQLA